MRGGSTSPLPVGSEKCSETCGSRRMLKAFAAKETDVVTVNDSEPRSRTATTGHATGVPSRAMVAISHVWNWSTRRISRSCTGSTVAHS